MRGQARSTILPVMNKAIFRGFCKLLGGLLLGSLALSAAGEEINPRELVRLVRQDCGSCHGMTLQGGLGTPLTREAMRDRPVESMAATILYGRPGTAMPPWKSLLSEAQANWIAEQLVQGFPEELR
jgi:cytochrome c55X